MRWIALLAALAVAMPTIAQETGSQTGSAGVGVPGVGPATTGTSPPPPTVLPGTQTGVRGTVSPTTTTDPTGATTSVGATGSSTIVKGTAGEGSKTKDMRPRPKHGKRKPGANNAAASTPQTPR
jgi:hypothetical protein